MKKLFLTLLAASLSVIFPVAASAAVKVALVFDAPEVINSRGVNQDIINAVAEKAAAIFPAPQYEIIAPNESIADTRRFCEEQKKYRPGTFNAATMQALGKKLGCDYIFFNRIERGKLKDELNIFNMWSKRFDEAVSAEIYCDTAIFQIASAKAVFTAGFKKKYKAAELDMNTDLTRWTQHYRRAVKSAMEKLAVPAGTLKPEK